MVVYLALAGGAAVTETFGQPFMGSPNSKVQAELGPASAANASHVLFARSPFPETARLLAADVIQSNLAHRPYLGLHEPMRPIASRTVATPVRPSASTAARFARLTLRLTMAEFGHRILLPVAARCALRRRGSTRGRTQAQRQGSELMKSSNISTKRAGNSFVLAPPRAFWRRFRAVWAAIGSP